MDKSDIEGFFQLKFCFANLMTDVKKDHVNTFIETLTNNINIALRYQAQHCLHFTIVCLRVKDLSNDKREELLKIVRLILQKEKIKTLRDFNDLYGAVLIQIYDENQANKVITSHEELKELVALCIKDIICQSFTDVIEQLYNKKNRVKLAGGLLLCLTMAKTEKSPAVRLAAIEAIMVQCYVHNEADRFDIVLREQVADTIMHFLPGIISGLQDIILEGEIQNHKITMVAIRAWGRIVSLIMHDQEETVQLSVETLMKTCNDISLSETLPHTKTSNEHQILKQDVRNRAWFDIVAIKLSITVDLLEKVRSHSHFKVRLELIESISLVLENCWRNMKPNIMALIDHLISLSEDKNADVREKANAVLSIARENFTRNHNIELTNLLEEKFYNLLTRLPTIIRWSSDEEQLTALNQFAGYLKLLGDRNLPQIMNSQAYTQRLLLSLVYIMEIDCSTISLLQTTTNVRDLDSTYFYGSDSWRQFKFLANDSLQMSKEQVVEICSLLGKFGDFNILLDAILELMSDAPSHRKELILLLNWILVSSKGPSVAHLFKEVVDFYISEEVWYLSLEVTKTTSLIQAQSNVVQCCLLMEGLGYIAQNLQRDYDTYLLKTLYLIMERAGNENSLISYMGIRTLEIIAKAQQHETIGDLLRANVDYFSFHIIMKLRQVELNTGVLDVVQVVMRYSEFDFLPYLQGIVEDVLGQLSNPYQKRNTCSFLRVFYVFITSMKTLLKCESLEVENNNNNNNNNREESTDDSSERIIRFLLEYYNAKSTEKKLLEGEEAESNVNVSNMDTLEKANEDYADSNAEDKQEEKELPVYAKIIIKIMKCCLNFLSSNDTQTSLMAMQTLQAGLTMLTEWENELLPIVHQLWHPLIDRFKDKNPLIINRSWQLLYILADISNDFIRGRTLRDVLPFITTFLIESSKESVKKGTKNIYVFTQTYKLQYELLRTLGRIARYLKLREEELWKILSDTQIYLSTRQNPILQACCIQLYKDIADYNGDIVWVKCLGIWNSNVKKIASDATFDIKDILSPTDVAASNEYYKHVQEIITYIERKKFNIR